MSRKIKYLNLQVTKPAGSRTLALVLIDPRTLVIGDQSALDRFLEADLKRKFQMAYLSPTEQAPPPKVEEKKADPKGSKSRKTTEAKPDVADAPKEDLRSFTSNPSFLSVDPKLKIMINQIDTERTRVLAVAMKIPDTEQPGGNFLKRFGGFGIDAVSLPKTPVVGLAVRRMDDSKLNAAAAIEYPNADEVLTYAANLTIASQLATALADIFGVPVRSTAGEPPAKDQAPPVKGKGPTKEFDPSESRRR